MSIMELSRVWRHRRVSWRNLEPEARTKPSRPLADPEPEPEAVELSPAGACFRTSASSLRWRISSRTAFNLS